MPGGPSPPARLPRPDGSRSLNTLAAPWTCVLQASGEESQHLYPSRVSFPVSARAGPPSSGPPGRASPLSKEVPMTHPAPADVPGSAGAPTVAVLLYRPRGGQRNFRRAGNTPAAVGTCGVPLAVGMTGHHPGGDHPGGGAGTHSGVHLLVQHAAGHVPGVRGIGRTVGLDLDRLLDRTRSLGGGICQVSTTVFRWPARFCAGTP